MPSVLEDFFQTYFVNPIMLNQGYNLINTTIYATILVIAAYLIYNALNKLHVKIDRRLGMSIAPFIIFGSASRVLVDANIFFSFLFITPLIYFVIFSATFITLIAALFIERKRKIPYYKTMTTTGIVFAAIPFALLAAHANNFSFNANALFLILAFFAPWPILFHFIRWKESNKVVASVQMFDATNTFVSLNFFGYLEQHFLPKLFIGQFGPASFIIVKAVAVIAALVLIDKYSDDRNFNNYLKLVIGILGSATSTRDFLRLVIGV
ncbi:MAG TPA: DUF63 family protein [archaeon]|nr:DUF63 family protein [archaeon]